MTLSSANDDKLDTLFYDSHCPVCLAEVNRLKKYAAPTLHFKDIYQLPKDHKPDQQQLLQRLHIQTPQGSWVVGLEANIKAWEHTVFKPLVKMLRLPILFQALQYAYGYWLKYRASKQKASKQCGC